MAEGSAQAAWVSTLRGAERTTGVGPPRVPALTILFHPDAARIGEVARLDGLEGGVAAPLSRVDLEFKHPTGFRRAPLNDPCVSRRAILLSRVAIHLYELAPAAGGTPVVADGFAVDQGRRFDRGDLERGVVIELADRVVLLWHLIGPPREQGPRLGLVGDSDAMEDLRDSIRRVADLPVAVLLRGESGVGKELVARAVHAASGRAEAPCVCINMAALPPPLAASELFGHAKGAFTGAAADHKGFFAQADGGTLFLDEIADAPVEVQAMLLRVIETNEVQPLGTQAARKVDVRLVAATDADLEAAVAEGRFRSPLLHRLAGYQIAIPPLRARRDDFGRLLVHFLRAELERVGELARLAPPSGGDPPWLPASLVARLARHDWPGNLRQLQNVVRQLVISNRGAAELTVDRALERMLAEVPAGASADAGGAAPVVDAGVADARAAAPVAPAAPAADPRRAPAALTDDELVAALARNHWRTSATAADLGISRTSLYALIDACPRVRKAKDLTLDEIEACGRACAGDVDAMAEALHVSRRGLQLRIKELRVRE